MKKNIHNQYLCDKIKEMKEKGEAWISWGHLRMKIVPFSIEEWPNTITILAIQMGMKLILFHIKENLDSYLTMDTKTSGKHLNIGPLVELEKTGKDFILLPRKSEQLLLRFI
jgi:hypothetical protein